MDLEDILNFDRLTCKGEKSDEGWYLDQDAILEAMDKLEIRLPVTIRLQKSKYRSPKHYLKYNKLEHFLVIPRNCKFAHANYSLWHELTHCRQAERWYFADTRRKLWNWHWDDYKAVDGDWGNRYRGNAYEIEANAIAAENADIHLVVFGT